MARFSVVFAMVAGSCGLFGAAVYLLMHDRTGWAVAFFLAGASAWPGSSELNSIMGNQAE